MAALAKKNRLLKEMAKCKYLYLLIFPAVVLVFIFSYIPMYGVIIAFKDYRLMQGILGSSWAGLYHFRVMFAGYSFYEVLLNTVVISLYRIIFGFPAPILLALLLNEMRHVLFKRVVQTISYLPYFLSWVVLAGIFSTVFALDRGFINLLLQLAGLEQIDFLISVQWFRTVLISTGIWQSFGWSSIIYLAVIAGINPELYEAAEIDGASRLRRAVSITIPSLIPVICILLILNLGGLFSAGFDQIYNLYSPSVYRVADVIDTYVYRQGLVNRDYSYATAVGLFQNVIGFMLIIGANFIVKRFNRDYGIW